MLPTLILTENPCRGFTVGVPAPFAPPTRTLGFGPNAPGAHRGLTFKQPRQQNGQERRWVIMSSRSLKVLTGTLLLSGLVAACSDDVDTPIGPDPDPVEFAFVDVQSTLQSACGSCHGEGSGRTFLTTMTEEALLASGLVSPAEPLASMILTKPRNAAGHGGGSVDALTDASITSIAEWIGKQPVVTLDILEAVRVVGLAPNADGYASEAVWGPSNVGIAVPIGGGWADAGEVLVKAAYDNDNIYILARWYDDAVSTRRSPWVKQADGSWAVQSAKTSTPDPGITWADWMGDNFEEETQFYEDKFAMIWNTRGASAIAGFDEQGCGVVCHDPTFTFAPGTTYNYDNPQLAAKKYTNAEGEVGDMWHWKLVRQNQHGKIDDQNVHYWWQGGEDPNHAGRSADAGSGGYASNPAVDGRPMYVGPSLTDHDFYILDSEKRLATQAELDALPVGAMLPNMITKGPTDVRADIDAYGVYNPATDVWTLEIRRPLVTGDDNDVQFTEMLAEYPFGVAVFDNAQIEHSWSPLVYKLKFIQ
jgi:Ethylbenzene dehydrogenase